MSQPSIFDSYRAAVNALYSGYRYAYHRYPKKVR